MSNSSMEVHQLSWAISTSWLYTGSSFLCWLIKSVHPPSPQAHAWHASSESEQTHSVRFHLQMKLGGLDLLPGSMEYFSFH